MILSVTHGEEVGTWLAHHDDGTTTLEGAWTPEMKEWHARHYVSAVERWGQ